MARNAINLIGVKELRAALDALPKELSKAAERTALREGAKPVMEAAKSYAKRSQDSGTLIESIGITVKVNKRGSRAGSLTARIGARRGFGRWVTRRNGRREYADPANYAHLVEYGTSRIPARPFIRPAIQASEWKIMSAMANGYRKGLDRAVKRARRKRR